MGVWLVARSRSPTTRLEPPARPECQAAASSRTQSNLLAFARDVAMHNLHGVARLLGTPAQQRLNCPRAHSTRTTTARRRTRCRCAGARVSSSYLSSARARAAALRPRESTLSAEAGVLRLSLTSSEGGIRGAKAARRHAWGLRGALSVRSERPRAGAGRRLLQDADRRRPGSVSASMHCFGSSSDVHGWWLLVPGC